MIRICAPQTLGLNFNKKSGLIPADVRDKLQEADQILAKAQAQATALLEEAEMAFANEKQRGYEEGVQEAQQEQIVFFQQAQAQMDKTLMGLEGQFLDTLKTAIEKIFYKANHQERAECLVRQGLSALRQENRIQLKVPQDLLPDFKTKHLEWKKDFPEVEVIDLIGDSSLADHQIILESSFGKIEPRIEAISYLFTR